LFNLRNSTICQFQTAKKQLDSHRFNPKKALKISRQFNAICLRQKAVTDGLPGVFTHNADILWLAQGEGTCSQLLRLDLLRPPSGIFRFLFWCFSCDDVVLG
jgi:hypothetical protein